MREMKDSGISWIGIFPSSWAAIPLKYNYNLIAGATPDSHNIDYWDGDVNWITPADFKTEQVYVSEGARKLTEAGFESCSTTMIPAGSIVFSKRAPIGTVAINTTELCTNQGCLGLVKKNKDTDNKFYYYVLSIYPEVFNLFGSGTTFREISSTAFGEVALPCPSVIEQHRISTFLDTKCSEIDTLTADIQSQIDTLEQYKRSVITEAVTKGLDRNVEMKESRIEWLSTIPISWQILRIADIFQETHEEGRDGLPFLMVSINTGVSDHDVSDEERTRKVVRGSDIASYKRVRPGDIIYNMMRAWQGAIGTARVDGIVSPAYVTARPRRRADSRYVEYLLRTPAAIEEMKKYSYGITAFRLRLYWPQFRNIHICMPSYEEQVAIADYCDSKKAEIDEIITMKQNQLTLLDKYKKSVIYEYATGKKEVPD